MPKPKSASKKPRNPAGKKSQKIIWQKKKKIVRAILQIFADSHYIYNGRHRSSKVGARVKNFQNFSKFFFGLKMI